METIRDTAYFEVGFVAVQVPDHWDRRESRPAGQNGRVAKRLRQAFLAAVFVAGAAGVPLAVYLTLHFAPPKAKAWIIMGMVLVFVATVAGSLGQFIIRWREKRTKVSDGPEADYHDPALPPETK